MNTGLGKCCVILRSTGRALWLLGLILPLDAMAQQQAPGMPGYNPWSMNGPYYQNQQPAPAAVPGNPGQRQAGPQPFAVPPPWAYPTMRTAPGYPQQAPVAARSSVNRPYLEIVLDSNEAYVHQNLVMTLQVVSPVNLKTVAAQLPENDDVIFRQLGEITASTRTRQGQREIVNTMYYQLTPLRSGNIELESIRVSGRMEGRSPGSTRYEAVADRPLQLMVLDPVAGVQPWLPLHELELSAGLSNDEHIGAGEPLTLTVEQRAVGMSGAQLPSLEAQLQAPGQRLYREKSEYQGTVSKQGALVGIRKDRFTLVPQQGNRVEIPAIRIDWWNVERKRKETAVLPSRLLNETGHRQGEQARSGVHLLGEAMWSVPVWLILLAIAFLLGRYWSRLVPVIRHSGHRLWQELDAASRPVRQQLVKIVGRLSPQRNLPLIRRRVADTLPRSARLWFCVRSADGEQDPDDWSQVLRFLINRRLGLSAQLPMSRLAEQIIAIHPGADADRIRALLSELEQAVFANHPMRDFDKWKKEFKHQIRPRPFASLGRRRGYLRTTGLPSLNPGVN